MSRNLPQSQNRRDLLVRLGLAVGLAGLGTQAWGQAGAQRGDPQAEQFVAIEAQKVLTLLADRNVTAARKSAVFASLVDEIADVPKISNFVLGKYARTITPPQRAAFTSVFRTYLQSVYQSRITQFQGDTLKVSGSTVRVPGDVVVSSVVTGRRDTVPVAWRVLGGGSAWKLVDVQISGVWLAITQRQDFVATIDNAGGNIDVLIAQLQRNARSGG